jgi:Zinc finger found in FPG and IleRS
VAKNDKPASPEQSPGKLELFHPAVRDWFESVFAAPTRPQSAGWPAIARHESTLILAPTGSEVCFASGVNPFRKVNTLTGEELHCLVHTARNFLLANVTDASGDQIVTYTGIRRTTGRSNVEEHLWVYGRRGEPCRRCGLAIESEKQGFEARTTFWCPQCQPMGLAKTFRNAAAG